MRWLGLFLAVLLPIVIGGPRSKQHTPNYAEQVVVRSEAVQLDSSDAGRTRVGSLTLIGGWKLSGVSPQFGGWSALHVDGDRFTAIGDAGTVLRFRLTRFGRAVEASIDPLPASCGQTDENRTRDSESLTGDGRNWWVGYESQTRLCRLDHAFRRGEAVYRPPLMAHWRKVGGPESVLRLADGRFLVFAEDPPRGEDMRPLLVFAGDPTDPRTPVTKLTYRPPEGFDPTDAAQLPDGRVLVLNRRFTLWNLFTSAITIIDPAQFAQGKVAEGPVIARFDRPLISDNFEGLAVTQEGDRTIVWMISDDNQMSWEATYLLKFALDAGAGKGARKPD
ncbi:MAG: esterase-like activity of phytase family protein [Sphingomonadales bacterium]